MSPKRFDDLPDIMTPAEVQQLLRCGRNWVYDRINDGTIPAVKVGRKIFVPKAALIRSLDLDSPAV
jgi:excisionase family DNA binding protein